MYIPKTECSLQYILDALGKNRSSVLDLFLKVAEQNIVIT